MRGKLILHANSDQVWMVEFCATEELMVEFCATEKLKDIEQLEQTTFVGHEAKQRAYEYALWKYPDHCTAELTTG